MIWAPRNPVPERSISASILALAAVAVFAGGFTQSVSGFGFGLVIMSVLPFAIGVPGSVAVVATLGFTVNVLVLSRVWRDLRWRGVVPLLIGAALGVPLGVWVLVSVDRGTVMGVLGGVLVVYSLWQLSPWRAAPRSLSVLWGLPAGFISGLFSGAFSTAGPPLVLYTTLTTWTKDTIKAALQVFFIGTGVVQVTLYALEGVLTVETLWLDLAGLPALGLGVFLGARVSDRIDQVAFRRLILVMLLVIGVIYLVRVTGGS